MLSDTELRSLTAVLEEAQRRGFVGPGPVAVHVTRALDTVVAIGAPPDQALDLGSGAGLPGLPLALVLTTTRWALLEGGLTRARFLSDAVAELGLSDRVTVVTERAEQAGRGELRGRFDLVVARSFGPPAATAECAAPFLRAGGRLIVAEPPGGVPDRWPAAGLDRLGMRPGPGVHSPSAFQIVEQVRPCPSTYPRRNGVPAKRLLF